MLAPDEAVRVAFGDIIASMKRATAVFGRLVGVNVLLIAVSSSWVARTGVSAPARSSPPASSASTLGPEARPAIVGAAATAPDIGRAAYLPWTARSRVPGDVVRLAPVAHVGGLFWDIEVDGDLAYYGPGRQLSVTRIGEDGRFDLIGHSALLPSSLFGLVRDGSTIYAAAGPSGLATIDVSRPAAPRLVSTLPLMGWALDVALDGGFLFVAAGAGGLRIVDVHDPAEPREVGTLEGPNLARRVVVTAGRAYVMDRDQSLFGNSLPASIWIVDVRDPSMPRQIGSIDLDARDLAVEGNLVYVLTGGYVSIMDVSDPTIPTEVGGVEGGGTSLAVRDGIVFSTYGGALSAARTDDPLNSYYLDDIGLGTPSSLIIDGDRAFLVASTLRAWLEPTRQPGVGEAIVAIDIARLEAMREIGRQPSIAEWFASCVFRGARAICLDLVDSRSWLAVLDISRPDLTNVVGRGKTPCDVYAGPAIRGALVYVAISRCAVPDENALLALDLAASDDLPEVGRLQLPDNRGHSGELLVDGERLYLHSDDSREPMRVIDVSSPVAPIDLGPVLETEGGYTAAVRDGTAFLLSNGQLRIVDVRDVGRAHLVGTIDIDSPWQRGFFGMALRGAHLFIGYATGELKVVDVSEPAQPRIVAHVEGTTPEWHPHPNDLLTPRDAVGISGDLLYVRGIDVQFYDITDPDSPRAVGQIGGTPGAGLPSGVAYATAHDGHLFGYEFIRSDADPEAQLQDRRLGLFVSRIDY